MNVNEKYGSRVEKELDEFCVSYFASDTDLENYYSENIYRQTKTTINWQFLAIIKICIFDKF